MTIERNGTHTTLITDERIDTYGAPLFAAQVAEALEGTKDLTLDFGRLTYISSSGLRVVMSAVKAMARQGDIRIVNVGEDVYDVLEATGFTGMCDVEMKA